MKNKSVKKTTTPLSKPVVALSQDKNDIRWILFIVLVAIVSFGFSVFNNYALDDFIVIVKNNFTQKGFSGIWNILSKDTFAGMTESNIMVLSGGRYRPLSLVTFAIENQLWGNVAFISHLINVSIYVIIGILLYKLLKQFFSFNSDEGKEWIQAKAAIITLLFMVLPAHSEPVINIKGRDDLMCLMFFLLCIIQLLKYIKSADKNKFTFSMIFFFLSLMSKETALTFVVIIPLILYFFTAADKQKIFLATSVSFSIALLFLFFRYLATKDNGGIPSTDVLNNPFAEVSTPDRIASVFLSWLYYFKLMIFPIHMSYDYNYNQFPITNFFDWRVILSVVIHVFLIIMAIRLFKRKSIYSFAILFYLITFSILSNLFFNIGTIFADRFIFIPSIGFCIIIVSAAFDLYKKYKTKQNALILTTTGKVVLLSILLIFSFRNIARCSDWKDNNTLFIADTDDAPNSAKIQLNAGIAYLMLEPENDSTIRDSLLHRAIDHLQKGIRIYPGYIDGYMNMGVAYSRLNEIENAQKWWDKARVINPAHPGFKEYDRIISRNYFKTGLEKGVEKNFSESISNLRLALSYDSTNADIYYNLGGAYFTIQRIDSAKYFFSKTLLINPSEQRASMALQAIQMQELRNR